jgi:DNA (cytosine-5)-methyltransferase 1
MPDEDVRDIEKLPPDTHLLFAGFPCPTFSIAGKSKLTSLGRKHGLEEERRGQLIFEVERIVAASEPKPEVIILENVKHLLHHDGGATFEVILELFRELGYESVHALLDAKDFGSAQQRERVFIVFFRDAVPDGFELPNSGPELRQTLASVLEEDVADKYTLGPGTWRTLKRHKKYHAERGNGFGFRLLEPNDKDAIVPTISARYHKDGSEALIPNPDRTKHPRRLTPAEMARLFCYPDDFVFPVSDTQAYRQLGNSIVVSVADAVVGAVVSALIASDRLAVPA